MTKFLKQLIFFNCSMEHLQEYLRELDESSDEESSDGEEEPTQMQKDSIISPSSKDEEDEEDAEEEHIAEEDDEEPDEDNYTSSNRGKSIEFDSVHESSAGVILHNSSTYLMYKFRNQTFL